MIQFFTFGRRFKSLPVMSIILVLFLSINIFSQWNNSSKGIQVNVLNTSPVSTTLEFILNDYDVTAVSVYGEDLQFYSVPGSIFLMEAGYPQLPTHRVSIIIPDLAGSNFRIKSQEITSITTGKILPSKGHFTRDIDPESVPYTFSDFYFSNEWYPAENVLIDVPYIVRDLRGQTVQFNPMQFNPAEGILKICKRLVVEVYDDPSVIPVNPFIRTTPLEGVAKEFVDIYKTLFVNYGLNYCEYVPVQEIGRLLIIYPTVFASNITPFSDWKQEKGIPTLLAEYPSHTGTGSAAIKNYIQNLYNSPDGLTFIVLVGEANQIPTMYGLYENAPSDPSYVKLAGSDAYPDAFISRISPSSATNLDYVLLKLIRYEKYPDTGPAAAWYMKGTGVASNEGSPPDWQRANWLRDMLINDMHFTQVDQIYAPGATATQVTTALNDGRSILNYLGHGSGTSWGTTGFSNTHIHNLSNGYKNPFIIDVACQNGNFTMNECMEEAWIRAGDMNNPKGAIAAFGSSTNASWVPPCDMQNHAIMLLTTRQMKTVGGVCFNGIMHAMDLWGGSTGEGLKLMEQYNIFGDCSMMLTMGLQPDTTAPEQITDLAASNPTSNSVLLTWTSPYDSSFGGVVNYDLRYSTTPILNNNDFNNAPFVMIPGEPDSAGMAKSYTISNLNFSTAYYFAIKALDIWGNKSEMSNVPVETTWGAPQMNVSPDSIFCILMPNSVHTEILNIANVTTTNSTLEYSIEMQNNTFPGDVVARIVPVLHDKLLRTDKDNPKETGGMASRGMGGPDLFGYKWIDSNEPNGPQYIWDDISTSGTLVTNWIPTGTWDPKDEGYAGPIPIGFNFKFYGNPKTQLYISSNGIVTFAPITTNIITNQSIPNTAHPNDFISPFWDDLDGRTQGTVHTKQDGNKFIVQFTSWQRYPGSGSLTFQVVLYQSGKILVYYNNMSATLNLATIGIENHAGNDGLQAAFNSAYVQNNMALQFSAEPDWLSGNNMSGIIYNGNSVNVEFTFHSEDYPLGNYRMDAVITSNDPAQPTITVPIVMDLVIPVELSALSLITDKNDVTVKWTTSTETNNMGFSIERKSGDENNWEEVAFVKGKGTTTDLVQYNYKDKSLSVGLYAYRLKQIDYDGAFSYSAEVETEVLPPDQFTLYQNYPNPFNPATTIKFSLPLQSQVKLSIYNSLGELVSDLIDGKLDAGYHEIVFNASGIASGVYYYRISANDFIATKKMLLIK